MSDVITTDHETDETDMACEKIKILIQEALKSSGKYYQAILRLSIFFEKDQTSGAQDSLIFLDKVLL